MRITVALLVLMLAGPVALRAGPPDGPAPASGSEKTSGESASAQQEAKARHEREKAEARQLLQSLGLFSSLTPPPAPAPVKKADSSRQLKNGYMLAAMLGLFPPEMVYARFPDLRPHGETQHAAPTAFDEILVIMARSRHVEAAPPGPRTDSREYERSKSTAYERAATH